MNYPFDYVMLPVQLISCVFYALLFLSVFLWPVPVTAQAGCGAVEKVCHPCGGTQ